ncbi:hypothetical protein CRG98_009445 [Punica granatum]|uniref:Reverse transcriptase domain-containing protein n=1 Tax=Punica granatum TaxID=22663 RepID=A0A2I0KNT5_PUNGR|nr:hypothetical protein CRG98_009445 [Punica granatum]
MRHRWALMRDFNAIKCIEEVKVVGRKVVIDQSMRDFADFMDSTELTDHSFIGCCFTWSNKRQEGFQARKINRVLVNEKWFREEIASTIEFLPPGLSDHCPAMLKFGEKENAGPRPFKFFHFWTEHSGYMELVERVWLNTQEGSPMDVLYKKLRNLKTHLRDFNKTEFGNVHAQVTDIQHELARVQSTLMDSACESPEAIKKETDLRVKLLAALDREEKLLKQKSMVEWLRVEDQNTSFFHKAVRGRMTQSTIRVLYPNSGAKLEGVQEIKAEAVKFFEGLLGTKDECIGGVLASKLSSILKRKVPLSKYQLLLSPIEDEEIKKALFSMGNDKSPGPNGFTEFFFKHAWHTV